MSSLLPSDNVLSSPEECLRRFCRATLTLLEEGEGPMASLAAPLLARAVADGSREVLGRLKAEIGSWETAAAHIRQLASSPLAGLGGEATRLLGRLEEAKSQAESVVATLAELEASSITEVEAPNRIAVVESPIVESPIVESPVVESPVVEAPVHATTLFEAAEEYRRSHRFEDAESLYGDALRLDPTFRPALLQRGRTRSLLDRPREAIADLSEALRLDSADALAYWWRGDALALCGQFLEAVADYTQALNLSPDLFMARYNRASALRQLGDLENALPEFDALLEERPDYVPLYLNRGLIRLARGEAKQAYDDFRAALSRQPDCLEASEGKRQAVELLRAQREPRAKPASADPVEAPAPTVPLLPAKEPTIAETEPLKQGSGKPLALEFACPGCGRAGSVRWDKLQRGKVLGCPHCGCHMTTIEDGQLVEVVRDASGRWVERKKEQEAQRRKRRTWMLSGAALAAVLAAGTLLWSPWRPWATAADVLPEELEPRGKMFVEAWLTGDQARMRRLTDPTQDKLLFGWYRRNKPIAWGVSDKATPEIVVTANQPPFAALLVRFPKEGSARKPVQMRLWWEERGGAWFFKPAPRHTPRKVDR